MHAGLPVAWVRVMRKGNNNDPQVIGPIHTCKRKSFRDIRRVRFDAGVPVRG